MWVTGAVEHRAHNDFRPPDLEEDPRRGTAEGALVGRMTLNRTDRRIYRGEELASEPGTLGVIPRVRVIKISLRLRGEAKSLYLRRASLARTSLQGFAADGLRTCERRRLASSVRWASVTGIACGVSTRLSQISSINTNRSSTLSESQA